jgi:hypothetical protein
VTTCALHCSKGKARAQYQLTSGHATGGVATAVQDPAAPTLVLERWESEDHGANSDAADDIARAADGAAGNRIDCLQQAGTRNCTRTCD